MRHKIAFLLLSSVAAGACSYTPGEPALERGVAAVNVPVVSRADYSFDLAAPGGSLPSSEEARLDAWFSGLQLGYGDTITIDGSMADMARADIARVAGRYGLLVSAAAPVTVGAIPDGAVRVVVSRTRASVPGCPNWSEEGAPNYNNRMISNYGCSVNSNIAAMIANPQDLVYGREGTGINDPTTSNRAVDVYRSTAPTGKGPLKAVSTGGK
ncbi:MAG TPA: CpaD family pilus assembly protein [Sphingomicrobium sp.]|jgi:pilus assembly protein CpaD|nr:CpaD family pilus assembly protein [Sphingomicrobium sp.]